MYTNIYIPVGARPDVEDDAFLVPFGDGLDGVGDGPELALAVGADDVARRGGLGRGELGVHRLAAGPVLHLGGVDGLVHVVALHVLGDELLEAGGAWW